MLTEIAFRSPRCVLNLPSGIIFEPQNGSDDPLCTLIAQQVCVYT